jgi:O-antigen/teichoic acid export membrane protein
MHFVSDNNKRIAKNTIFLYIRLLFSLIVSLYTSRVVLSVLGVDDFGLNAIVTSVIAMFNFLNHSMAVSTSRFLTFELGKNDFEKLKRTFSASLTIHVIIAVVVFIFGETVGLWYLENKMVVPQSRMMAARWVYQLSLLSAMLAITQSPYNASIISHEKMNVYAYIEITNTFFRLIIVYILAIGNIDKLILYAILTLCVSIVIALLYRIYCIRHFKECKYRFEWDRKILYPIISLSGWNLYANVGLDTKDKGVNLILNLFFTTVVNAAYGLANQVSAAINSFNTNFLTAVKPQIVKYYAENRIAEMSSLVINATKYSVLLSFALSFPIIVEINFILKLWLKNVPDYANIFCQLFLTIAVINTLWSAVNYIIYATGKVRTMSFTVGTIYLAIPAISYLLFRFINCRIVYAPLLISIAASIAVFFVVLLKTRSLIPQFSISRFLRKAILISLIVIVISSILPLCIHFLLDEGWLRLILVILSLSVAMAVTIYCIVLNQSARNRVLGMIKNNILR